MHPRILFGKFSDDKIQVTGPHDIANPAIYKDQKKATKADDSPLNWLTLALLLPNLQDWLKQILKEVWHNNIDNLRMLIENQVSQ